MFWSKKSKIILYAVILYFLYGFARLTGIEERLAYWYYCRCPERYELVSGVVTDTAYYDDTGRYTIYSAHKKTIIVTYIIDGQQNTCTLIQREGDQIENTVTLAIADTGLFKIARVDNLTMALYEGLAIAQFLICFFVFCLFLIGRIMVKKDGKRMGRERVRIKKEHQYREEMLARFPVPEKKCPREVLRRTNVRCEWWLGNSLPGRLRWFLTHMNLDYFIEKGYLFKEKEQEFQFVEATRRLTSIGIWDYIVLKHEEEYYLLYRVEDGMMYKYDLNEAEAVGLNCNFYEYFLHNC